MGVRCESEEAQRAITLFLPVPSFAWAPGRCSANAPSRAVSFPWRHCFVCPLPLHQLPFLPGGATGLSAALLSPSPG